MPLTPWPVLLPMRPSVLGKTHGYKAVTPPEMRTGRFSRGPGGPYTYPQEGVRSPTPADLAPLPCTHSLGEALHPVTHRICNHVMKPRPFPAQPNPTFLLLIQDLLGICWVPHRYWAQM